MRLSFSPLPGGRLLAFGCTLWLAAVVRAPAAPAAHPEPPPRVLYRPVFLTPDFSHDAGMAFRLRDWKTGKPYLVTSLSAFGPLADLDVQMTPDDIARVIVGAIGVPCDAPRQTVVAPDYVYMSAARRSDKDGSEGDMALFEIAYPPGEAPALTLDLAPPIKGDRIWIYFKQAGGTALRLEGATITWATDKEIRYLLDDPKADLRRTTGAPLLSLSGRVVGIHIGTGTFPDKPGRLYGYACPASAIQRHLDPNWVPPKSPLK